MKKIAPMILALFLVAIKIVHASQDSQSSQKKSETSVKVTSSSNETSTNRMRATIAHCRDGDTCRITTTEGHMWMNVRLAGIDAPEIESKRKKSKGQPLGQKAKAFANDALAGQQVEIEQVDLDNYNRPIVVVWKDNKNFNLSIVESGLAEAYRGRVKRIRREDYLDAENRAKSARKGVWEIPPEKYESPEAYRKSLRAN